MWQRCGVAPHRCHRYFYPDTALLVGVWIEPFWMPVLICWSSDFSAAGTLLSQSWNGASDTPPLASVPM